MILDAMDVRVTTEMNEELVLPFTDEEIKCALFSNASFQESPSPDDMSPCFFYWGTCSGS